MSRKSGSAMTMLIVAGGAFTLGVGFAMLIKKPKAPALSPAIQQS